MEKLTSAQRAAYAAVYGAFRERMIELACENGISHEVAGGMLLVAIQCREDETMNSALSHNAEVAATGGLLPVIMQKEVDTMDKNDNWSCPFCDDPVCDGWIHDEWIHTEEAPVHDDEDE